MCIRDRSWSPEDPIVENIKIGPFFESLDEGMEKARPVDIRKNVELSPDYLPEIPSLLDPLLDRPAETSRSRNEVPAESFLEKPATSKKETIATPSKQFDPLTVLPEISDPMELPKESGNSDIQYSRPALKFKSVPQESKEEIIRQINIENSQITKTPTPIIAEPSPKLERPQIDYVNEDAITPRENSLPKPGSDNPSRDVEKAQKDHVDVDTKDASNPNPRPPTTAEAMSVIGALPRRTRRRTIRGLRRR